MLFRWGGKVEGRSMRISLVTLLPPSYPRTVVQAAEETDQRPSFCREDGKRTARE